MSTSTLNFEVEHEDGAGYMLVLVEAATVTKLPTIDGTNADGLAALKDATLTFTAEKEIDSTTGATTTNYPTVTATVTVTETGTLTTSDTFYVGATYTIEATGHHPDYTFDFDDYTPAGADESSKTLGFTATAVVDLDDTTNVTTTITVAQVTYGDADANVTVEVNGTTLTKDTDYTQTVTFTDAGTGAGTVEIEGINGYKGTVEQKFNVTAYTLTVKPLALDTTATTSDAIKTQLGTTLKVDGITGETVELTVAWGEGQETTDADGNP